MKPESHSGLTKEGLASFGLESYGDVAESMKLYSGAYVLLLTVGGKPMGGMPYLALIF